MRSTLVLLFICFIGHARAAATSPGDTTNEKHFIDMKGRVIVGKKALAKASVKVYADTTSNIVQRMETDEGGYLALHLFLQKSYTIKISKPGYVTKIVSLDAHLPEKHASGDYYFEFSMDLFEELEGLDVSMLKYPVAIITFNTFKKNFDYDYNYTSMINMRLKKLYDQAKALKKGKKQDSGQSPAVKDTTSMPPPVPQPKMAVVGARPKTTYSVEIFSSSEQMQKNSAAFKGMVNVKEYQENGTYKYYVGDYPTQKDAEKMRDNIAGFFPNATIISFFEGKKVTADVVDIPHEK